MASGFLSIDIKISPEKGRSTWIRLPGAKQGDRWRRFAEELEKCLKISAADTSAGVDREELVEGMRSFSRKWAGSRSLVGVARGIPASEREEARVSDD